MIIISPSTFKHSIETKGVLSILFPILLVLTLSIVLPAIFIIVLWRAKFNSKFEWMLDLVATLLIINWITMAGNWSWVGYYFRFFWPILFIIAIYFSWRKTRHLPLFKLSSWGNKLTVGVYLFLIFIFGTYNISVLKSHFTDDNGIQLDFPLKDGTYYVAQGGNDPMLNYHQIIDTQKYALDILKINRSGNRAKGLYPKELGKYHIYGDDLFSPCDGTVISAQNDSADLSPPNVDKENLAGNYVELVCDHHDATILMAHMKRGTVIVSAGDQIKPSQKIGRVGNSGNTTEPHLHIHAEKNGQGVPIFFNDQFLVRNNLVR